jgi:hypothetical protein
MIVVKYFYEEPTGLEVLAEDTSASARAGGEELSLEAFFERSPYYRGYLAATTLRSMKTGATAGRAPDAWVLPLVVAVSRGGWWSAGEAGSWVGAEPREVLRSAPAGAVLVTAAQLPGVEAPRSLAGGGVRRSLAPLRELLDAGTTVLISEPAPDGVDWSVFSPQPLAERLRRAFSASPGRGVRRFVIPFREARGEQGFYFERYDLSLYASREVR